ncbi:DUF6036 family nucleotidyltransferase [soil metagenome]
MRNAKHFARDENYRMTAEEITKYLSELSDELAVQNVKGEICLYGGAVMCLAFKARPATKDIDAIFEPVKQIRRAASKIAERHNLNIGWLNFAVRIFVVEHEKRILFDFPNLKIFIPETDYLLAMKILAARADTSDLDDIKFLVRNLQIETVEEAVKLMRNYYPHKEIKPETIFLLEEILEK